MNPILLDFPEEFHTERLLIRKPMPGDGKAAYLAIQASINRYRTKRIVYSNGCHPPRGCTKGRQTRIGDSKRVVGKTGAFPLDFLIKWCRLI